MRIVAGKLKGRRFQPPKNIPARPTTDFAKEGLFNILTNHFDLEDVSFLDLFAGTGSLSYEMASRGSSDIVSVEKDGRSAAFIKKSAEEFHLNINVMQLDVFQYLRNTKRKFDIIFAGPPYALENLAELPNEIFELQLLATNGWFILEHNPHHNFDLHLNFKNKRNYGSTIFSIFENKNLSATDS
ncbi:MAG: RsmD family RNA methyltransferase [Chitinophagales bacterium]|nr:RsmD family RNA methyltransferase [Chitinophagales bacterium]